ncbi:MAG TPA: hypothetical protein VF095_05425 [Bacillota bacterium]
MKDFLQMCHDAEEKLGRKLEKKELEFLQWVFERYVEEKEEIQL